MINNHVGCVNKQQIKKYEYKQLSEVDGTCADDHPGRFPDLLNHRQTRPRSNPQRLLCRKGYVCCHEKREIDEVVKVIPERRIKNMADEPTQADLDNHANQLNPNNDEYWNSRDQGDGD